jgi:hypothetical protein
MKKLIVLLTVMLLAGTSMAAVSITATPNCDGSDRWVDISFVADVNVSGFGLDITVSDGNIVDVANFFTGEGAGYGIFPGSFNANINPADPNWDDPDYSPVASGNGALGGLGTGGVTVELGALYDGDANQPAQSGLLLSVLCDSDCTISVAANTTRCGDGAGAVLEDASAVAIDVTGATDVAVSCGPEDCLVVGQTIGGDLITQAMYDLWVTNGKPDSWCYDCFGYGDTNGDCLLTYAIDINKLKQAWNTGYLPEADFNKDGVITYAGDINRIKANWTTGCPGDCVPVTP